jgi:hypothetical protein
MIQRHIFGASDIFSTELSYEEIASDIVYPTRVDLDYVSLAQKYGALNDEAVRRGKTFVVSCERLCGNPHSGGYDRFEIADRLYSLSPDAKILITLRNQQSAIVSNYKQYVREGGIGSLKYYTKGDVPERIPTFNLEYFEYDKLVRYYFSLFGKSRVKVMFFEDLKKNQRNFCNEIIKFSTESPVIAHEMQSLSVGVENRSFSYISISILRFFNVFSYYPSMGIYPLVRIPGRKNLRRALTVLDRVFFSKLQSTRLEQQVGRLVKGRYKESNMRLSGLLGIELRDKGYE